MLKRSKPRRKVAKVAFASALLIAASFAVAPAAHAAGWFWERIAPPGCTETWWGGISQYNSGQSRTEAKTNREGMLCWPGDPSVMVRAYNGSLWSAKATTGFDTGWAYQSGTGSAWGNHAIGKVGGTLVYRNT